MGRQKKMQAISESPVQMVGPQTGEKQLIGYRYRPDVFSTTVQEIAVILSVLAVTIHKDIFDQLPMSIKAKFDPVWADVNQQQKS